MFDLVIVGASVLGAVSVATLLEQRRQRWKRLRAGRAPLAEGEVVTMTGTIRLLGEPLRAPLSGTPCALYRVVGRSASVSSPGLGTWHAAESLAVENVLARFALMTSHGEVLVDGEQIEITWPVRRVSPRRPDRELAVRLRLGFTKTQAVSLKEVAIADGATVSVRGVLHRELATSSAERDFRDARTLLVLRGHPDHPLTVSRPTG